MLALSLEKPYSKPFHSVKEEWRMDTRKQVDTQQVVVWYTREHLTTEQIGKLIGRTRARVCQILKREGVTRAQGTWVDRSCGFCGQLIKVRRCLARKVKESFCSDEHYYASRENPAYYQCRTGQRLARAVVSQHFKLLSGHVVHHEYGDNRHNDRANLKVFASNSDHIAYHHG